MNLNREYGLYNKDSSPGRIFNWVPLETLSLVKRNYNANATLAWVGRIYCEKEKPHFMDTGDFYLLQVPGGYSYAFTVRNSLTVGPLQPTLEDAAEDFYKEFYRKLTWWKYNEAMKPTDQKQVAILGKWITATDYYEFYRTNVRIKILQDAANDERDDRMFALGLGDHEVGLVVPRAMRTIKHQYIFNPALYTLLLGSGHKISGAMDWWVWCPEQYVKGEVYCDRCGRVYGSASNVKWIRSLGPRCGPSRDDMTEKGEIDDTYWDFDERFA